MADKAAWSVAGCSVRGASHERSGLPNQDAIGWGQAGPAQGALTLALADGHSSPRCFRSDIGSRLAVQAALSALDEAMGRSPAAPGPPATEPSAEQSLPEESLPEEIVRRWDAAVDAELAAHPFEPAEFERLQVAEDERAREAVEAHPRLAYGTTLVAVAVTESSLLYFQIGDGDILTVADDGQVSRPLPRDERLFANQTTSLCTDQAWHDARMAVQSLADTPPPALILLSTDGYANSFPVEAEFLKVGPDLLALLRQHGLDAVSACLPGWLAEATHEGSGDDVTLGLIYRIGALEPGMAPAQPAEADQTNATEATCSS